MFVTICYYFIVTIIIIITIIITLLLSLLPIIFTPSAPLASAPPYDSNSTSASTTPISRQPLHPYSSFLFFSFSPLPTPLSHPSRVWSLSPPPPLAPGTHGCHPSWARHPWPVPFRPFRSAAVPDPGACPATRTPGPNPIQSMAHGNQVSGLSI